MQTIRVGETRQPQYQEWSGAAGSGDKLAPAGPVVYSSDNAAVAVDPNTGVITGVSVTTSPVNITAADSTDNLVTPPAQINVIEVAQSSTLDYPG